ncbi:hypothetical protein A3SI_06984 [Nitritalea halalkaliphila LW7]|uniref:Seryl-tRNA synthetase n=1 Tax=Nitritalea halalkaliphila LW7 TaxID=1189621 RepID=I5C5E9_9BACT|nr:hypothetical protein [Nitritalea halalkaliphila]EIM77051.1 hypothetical protein A3SI_06984 [Nitritalea halalkaliphila LW7]
MIKQLLLACALVVTVGFSAWANLNERTDEKVAPVSAAEEMLVKSRAEEISERVDEIKDMDFSAMTSTERKEVRKELKALKKEAKKQEGVYLSVGAIIIILLILILIT